MDRTAKAAISLSIRLIILGLHADTYRQQSGTLPANDGGNFSDLQPDYSLCYVSSSTTIYQSI